MPRRQTPVVHKLRDKNSESPPSGRFSHMRDHIEKMLTCTVTSPAGSVKSPTPFPSRAYAASPQGSRTVMATDSPLSRVRSQKREQGRLGRKPPGFESFALSFYNRKPLAPSPAGPRKQKQADLININALESKLGAMPE